MADRLDVLPDDRALVEIGGHEVGGRPGELHAPLPRLVVGLGPLEPRQERVVDVDDPGRVATAEVVTEHLHVAGEHHRVDLEAFHEIDQGALGLGLGVDRDGDVLVGDAVTLDQLAEVGVVRDHHRDVDREVTAAVAIEQVEEAVIELRHHDQRPPPLVLPADTQHATDIRRGVGQTVGDLRRVLDRRLEAGPDTEGRGDGVAVLGVLEDVGVEADQRAGDGGNDALAVGALQRQDVDRHPVSLELSSRRGATAAPARHGAPGRAAVRRGGAARAPAARPEARRRRRPGSTRPGCRTGWPGS